MQSDREREKETERKEQVIIEANKNSLQVKQNRRGRCCFAWTCWLQKLPLTHTDTHTHLHMCTYQHPHPHPCVVHYVQWARHKK